MLELLRLLEQGKLTDARTYNIKRYRSASQTKTETETETQVRGTVLLELTSLFTLGLLNLINPNTTDYFRPSLDLIPGP